MTSEQTLTEIREANLTYLMLSQNLIRQDKAQALFRLGISEASADLIAMLSPSQIMKLASSNMLLCRFRADDERIWRLLTQSNPAARTVNESTARLHANLLDRNRPLWETYVIEGLPGGRFAVYNKIHHALVDGVTGGKMAANGLCLNASEHKPPLWALPYKQHPTSRPKVASPGLLEQLGSVLKAGKEILPGVGIGLWDIVRAAVSETTAALPFQAPPSPFNVEISGSRRFASQSYSLARFKHIGEATGATVNDVTLAICAGALREYLLSQNKLPRKPLVAMVPVSLHAETDAGGNQVSLLLASLATNIADPLKRLQRIVESTKHAKDRLAAMPRLQKWAHGVTTISPLAPGMVTGMAEQHPVFNLVISNVPGPRETLYLNGARLDEVYPVSIPTHYLALNITISGYGDRLGFGYIACRRSVPALQRMLDYTHNAILELEVALGIGSHPSPKETPKPASRVIKSTTPKTATPKGAAKRAPRQQPSVKTLSKQ